MNLADVAKNLGRKIEAAEKRYEVWNKKYHVDKLYKYYQGFHWDNEEDKYVFNLVMATIETKLPSMVFTNPQFFITPKPKQLAENAEMAFQYAQNLEDTILDWTSNEANNFSTECEAAIFDAFFGFGIVEIGYSASFTENPNAQKPEEIGDGKRRRENKFELQSEQAFVKQIPFDTFRVSTFDARYLERCEWCGYYEWMNIEDLRADRNLKGTDRIGRGKGGRSDAEVTSAKAFWAKLSDDDPENFSSDEFFGDYVKVWKIWDNRAKKKYLFEEESETVLHVEKFKSLPLSTMRFRAPRKGFYPVPPVWHWIPMQNELNEVREVHRAHRRKFKRIYGNAGNENFEELQRAINGPDGAIVNLVSPESFWPIPTAEVGQSANISMQVSKDDFNVVSGTTAEMRGESDRITATQANITNQRAEVRESRERMLTGRFLVAIAKRILMTIKERMVNQFQVGTRETETLGMMVSSSQAAKTIDPLEDLGPEDFDFDVKISVESMSPVQNQEELNRFLNFISLLKQFPEFSASPSVIREMAFRCGYKNETIIRELQQMAQLQMVAQIEAAAGSLGMGGGGGNLAQQTVEQQTPPNVAEIQNQLAEQGLPMQGSAG